MLQLYVNYTSDGLSTYKSSFALTLAKFSLGNLNNGSQKDYIMQSACDVLSMLVLFAFYLHWRSFHNELVESEEKDFKTLDPAMYVVSIVGFDQKTKNL
jgi:tellurite resistance protein TehA-like permease